MQILDGFADTPLYRVILLLHNHARSIIDLDAWALEIHNEVNNGGNAEEYYLDSRDFELARQLIFLMGYINGDWRNPVVLKAIIAYFACEYSPKWKARSSNLGVVQITEGYVCGLSGKKRAKLDDFLGTIGVASVFVFAFAKNLSVESLITVEAGLKSADLTTTKFGAMLARYDGVIRYLRNGVSAFAPCTEEFVSAVKLLDPYWCLKPKWRGQGSAARREDQVRRYAETLSLVRPFVTLDVASHRVSEVLPESWYIAECNSRMSIAAQESYVLWLILENGRISEELREVTLKCNMFDKECVRLRRKTEKQALKLSDSRAKLAKSTMSSVENDGNLRKISDLTQRISDMHNDHFRIVAKLKAENESQSRLVQSLRAEVQGLQAARGEVDRVNKLYDDLLAQSYSLVADDIEVVDGVVGGGYDFSGATTVNRVLIFGFIDSWRERVAQALREAGLQLPVVCCDVGIDLSLLTPSDFVLYNIRGVPHSFYYKLMTILKRNGIQFLLTRHKSTMRVLEAVHMSLLGDKVGQNNVAFK